MVIKRERVRETGSKSKRDGGGCKVRASERANRCLLLRSDNEQTNKKELRKRENKVSIQVD
jgi:hypothetical protein